jgi:hypothetical protein
LLSLSSGSVAKTLINNSFILFSFSGLDVCSDGLAFASSFSKKEEIVLKSSVNF